MSVAAELFRSRICTRAIAVMLMGFGAAGCSAEPNGYNNDPSRRHSETTGSFRPDWQSMSQNLRPPMPVPEEPVTRPVGIAPANAVTRDRDGSRHVATAHSSGQGTSSGQKPIETSSRHGRPLAEVKKAENVAPPPETRRRDPVAVPDVKKVNVQPKSGIALGRQAPPQPPAASPAPAPAVDGAASTGTLKAAEAGSTFHWPVRGLLIAGFGSRINGQPNSGINVAVPEDTPIKAADDGVVLYSGNGLKAYGNLLLVRHPNGYVTVYAHARELLVKAGDEIKRDQIVAKSGKSGDVDRPQVHFEIRKASAPVNPMQYLDAS